MSSLANTGAHRSKVAGQQERPKWYVTLANFPEVIVTAHRCDEEPWFFQFKYSGFQKNLIAAGVMTAAMAVSNGKHRRDPDGGRVHITRYWCLKKDGRSHRYWRIRRTRAVGELARWPGVVEALAAQEQFQAWDSEQRPWACEEHRGEETLQ